MKLSLIGSLLMLLPILTRAEPQIDTDLHQAQTNLFVALLNEPAPAPYWEDLPRERLFPVPNPEEDSTPLGLLKKWRNESRIRIHQYEDKDTSKPSIEEQHEILAACEIYPGALTSILEFLDDTPDIQDAVYELYQKGMDAEFYDTDDREEIAQWLMQRGQYLRPQLIQQAKAFHFNGEYLTDDDPLEWLAELDWPTAKTILCTHASSDEPHVQTHALIILYEKAEQEERAEIRTQLITIAENKNLPDSPRADACKVMLDAPWEGREEWFTHLLTTEPQLSHRMTQLLADHIADDPDQLIPIVTQYIDQKNRIAHTNAVLCLSYFNDDSPRADALRPLLPWLSEPRWVDHFLCRLSLIFNLKEVRIPESVTGLIWILLNEDDRAVASAADALAFQGATNALPALRKALDREIDASAKDHVISAIHELGGFSLYEIATSVEIYATKRPADRETTAYAIGSFMDSPWNERFNHEHPVTPALLFYADQLEATDPDTANTIREIVSDWSKAVNDELILAAIQAPLPTADQIKIALNQCHQLRDRQQNALTVLSNGSGFSSAIATVIQENAESAERILRTTEPDLQTLLLACARLNRMELPINLVINLYDPEQKTLALAVDRYLWANDSQPARRARERLHPNERIISGAQYGDFDPDDSNRPFFVEEEIPEILGMNDENPPDEVYLLSSPFSRSYGTAITVHGISGTLYNLSGPNRFASRALTTNEVARFTDFIKRNRINELPAFDAGVSTQRGIYEYAFLTPTNGCIVHINNPSEELEHAPIYSRLIERFHEIRRVKPLTLRYHGIDMLEGFEILHPRFDKKAQAVWSGGDDTRVLLEVNRDLSRWHSFTGAVGAVIDQPAACNIVGARADLPQSLEYHPAPWKCTTPHGLIRTGDIGDDDGLWLYSTNSEPEKLLEGRYARAITSSNGEWIIAKKNSGHRGESLVLFDLVNREEHPVPLPVENFYIIAYLDHLEAFLVGIWDKETKERTYFAVDPSTGKARTLAGIFWPLEDLTYRPLQATATEGLSWAAKYDEEKQATVIGLYDISKFAFEPVMWVPNLYFNSMDMWVNEEQAKVYLVINGDLIRFSLLKEMNPL
ncbi:hypothetical protein P4C99_02000 [Pontiellaceae bacterium B1224]|nr:hypothetical protein [Pontiellaceae bacterium B1224]